MTHERILQAYNTWRIESKEGRHRNARTGTGSLKYAQSKYQTNIYIETVFADR